MSMLQQFAAGSRNGIGVGLETLWGDAALLVVFAVVLLALAIRKTRKRLH